MNSNEITGLIGISAISIIALSFMIYYMKVMIDDNPFKKTKNT